MTAAPFIDRQIFDPAAVAARFVGARLSARSLPDFPGPLPADLAAGYRCQDEAIAIWPDTIAGWKVGLIPPDLQAELGAERVTGPIFSRNVSQSGGLPSQLSAIPGGFAAVEAEYVYRMGCDAPSDRTDWTPLEALSLVDEEFVGVEFAGSPLATINILGPKVVASDFGNNAALILGKAIPNWRDRDDDGPACSVRIDGELVGRGSPSAVKGGPAAALAFLLNACAARGRPLKKGQFVTTGAASGIHDIEAGQTARISFGDLDEIICSVQAARPAEGLGGENHGRPEISD